MAPSTSSALHPIVIPPIHLPPFTTLGNGLLHATHPRENLSTLRALLSTPYLSNAKPKSWWRAQCLLYGLPAPEKRTVEELRTALELALIRGGLQVPKEMAEMERRENGRFRTMNAQVREATAGAAKGRVGQGRKDPLKPKAPGKVTKAPAKQPAAPKNHVTVNVTIRMPSPTAKKPATKKAVAKAPPKPHGKTPATKKAVAKALPKPGGKKK